MTGSEELDSALVAVAAATTVLLVLLDLHLELLAGTAAWLATWLLVRRPV